MKTNAMRILDKLKIEYEEVEYDVDEFISGSEVAKKTNQNPAYVYKTIICQGSDKNHYVFVVSVNSSLDLKACAKAVSIKSLELIHVKDITRVSGYVRGGCSPIGMKKQFVTTYDRSILDNDFVLVSGGKIGTQIKINPQKLIEVTGGNIASISY